MQMMTPVIGAPELTEAPKSMGLKQIAKKFKREIDQAHKDGGEVDRKLENALFNWALDAGELHGDDVGDLEDWLEVNFLDKKDWLKRLKYVGNESVDEALSPSYKNKYIGKDKASLKKTRNSFLTQIDDLIKFKKKTTKSPEVVKLQDLLKQVDFALKGGKESVEMKEALSDSEKSKRLKLIKKAVEKISKTNADKAKKDALQMMKDSGMFDESVDEASKYLKYSDLMKDYAVSFAKDGGLGPASKKIKAAMDKEKKKLGIEEGKEEISEKFNSKKELSDVAKIDKLLENAYKSMYKLQYGKSLYMREVNDGIVEARRALTTYVDVIMTGSLDESVEESIDEGMDFWRVTVIKPINKLKKGRSVVVKARNSAEALTKGAKNMGDPMANQSGYMDAVKDKKESVKNEDAPCWDGYKQVGMKKKDGKNVPNCVPESVGATQAFRNLRSKLNEARLFKATLDFDMGDPRDHEVDWEDDGVYIDSWDKREMELVVVSKDKRGLQKWLVDVYGLDKKEAQRVVK